MAGDKGIRAGQAFVEIFAEDKKLVRGLRGASRKIKAFGANIRNMGLQLTAASSAVLAPIALAVKHFANFGDNIAKMAKRTGMGVEALSALRYVASQTGTSLDDMEKGIRRMQRSISDAGRGLSTAKDALKSLGLTFADLDGLTPEKQFRLIGKRLGAIADPTKRAALSMELFGRAGTGLLPMFALGADGMDSLIKKAHDLGLVISREDAKAAEELTDALDTLKTTMKMIAFHIGAALGGAVKKIADYFTDLTKSIAKWVKENRGVVVTVTQIVVTVGAVGMALVGLGLTIQVIGVAVAGLAKIFVIFGVVLKAVIGILGFLISPLGLIIAAIVGLGVVIATTTNAGGKALRWLGDKFSVLKDDAIKSFGAIGDALAAGNLALAAKILWLLLKMEWQRGVSALTKLWSEFTFGFKAIFYTLKHDVLGVWASITHGLKNTWAGFMKWHKSTVEKWGNWFAKRMIEIEGLLDDSLDVDFAKKNVDAQSAARMKQIETDYQKQKDKNKREYDSDIAANEEARKKKMGELVDADADTQSQAAKDLAKARREWKDAVDAAKAGRDAIDAPAGGDKKKDGAASVSSIVAKAAVGVMGSFGSTRNIAFGSEAKDREALDAAKQTAKNTKKLVEIIGDTKEDFE